MILRVGGQQIADWRAGSVGWQVNALCGVFSLERHAFAGDLPPAVQLGAACRVLLRSPAGEQTALCGVIDDIGFKVVAGEVRTGVQGRSQSADLIDCATPLAAWQNQTALQIAKALCAPYGVQVADEAGRAEPFAQFATQPGETAAQACARLATSRGVWLGDAAPLGGLRFFVPGAARTPYRLAADVHVAAITTHTSREKHFAATQVFLTDQWLEFVLTWQWCSQILFRQRVRPVLKNAPMQSNFSQNLLPSALDALKIFALSRSERHRSERRTIADLYFFAQQPS